MTMVANLPLDLQNPLAATTFDRAVLLSKGYVAKTGDDLFVVGNTAVSHAFLLLSFKNVRCLTKDDMSGSRSESKLVVPTSTRSTDVGLPYCTLYVRVRTLYHSGRVQ